MTLNIERYNRFSYLWRFEPNTPNGFGEILFYKLEIFTENVCLINFFCHSAISQILMAEISFNIACKELKIKQIAQLNQLFQFLHLVHISGHGWLSRMLMRKNVNNDVVRDHDFSVLKS